MLDIPAYRLHEELAKNSLPSWQLSRRHSLDVFEKVGFPVRLSMLCQLRLLLNTMQEGRFDLFMQELGGFTEEDMAIFVKACHDLIKFQCYYFSEYEPIIPFDSLMAPFLIYQKIRSIKKDFKTILEIGPGCGYLSLFLKNLPSLQNYSQIEACESFYLLQHHINQFAFGNQFEQTLFPKKIIGSHFYAAEYADVSKHLLTDRSVRGDFITVNAPSAPKVALQYPWWNIGSLVHSDIQFDVVTSNANLSEFTPAALEDYLSLIQSKLASDGIFFVQCFGGGSVAGRTINYVMQRLFDFGFAPVFIALEGTSKATVEWITHDQFLGPVTGDNRSFVLSNAVFVGNEHKLFKECYRPENFRNGYFARISGLREAFFPDKTQRSLFDKEAILSYLS
ncbi:MAG: hypothetical protein H6974_03305 [Gammaproteobacteria bacterium]|nr:hypothetical protein [Gammaproteobacteria bacterium]